MQVNRKDRKNDRSIAATMLGAASPLIETAFYVLAALPFAAIVQFMPIW